MSNRIARVLSEDNDLKTAPKRLAYSRSVQTSSGRKTALSTHSTQERLEAPKRTPTRHANHDWYHEHGNGALWLLTGTM